MSMVILEQNPFQPFPSLKYLNSKVTLLSLEMKKAMLAPLAKHL